MPQGTDSLKSRSDAVGKPLDPVGPQIEAVGSLFHPVAPHQVSKSPSPPVSESTLLQVSQPPLPLRLPPGDGCPHLRRIRVFDGLENRQRRPRLAQGLGLLA